MCAEENKKRERSRRRANKGEQSTAAIMMLGDMMDPMEVGRVDQLTDWYVPLPFLFVFLYFRFRPPHENPH